MCSPLWQLCLVLWWASLLALISPVQAAEPILGDASAIADISGIWSKTKVSAAADIAAFAGASNIFRALAHAPAPKLRAHDAVDPVVPAAACDRDFGRLCPEGFVRIGPVRDGSDEYCAAATDYTGPCDGAYSFSGLSSNAKARWSEKCLASWPCKKCSKVSSPCPMGWVQEEGVCSPSVAHEAHGACGPTDFGSYNAAMREAWSSQCGAHWECDATLGHETKVAFLATRTIPIDAYKIRNSLYLTQPMREPPQASINVVMREDLHELEEESKYRGMEDQAAQLREDIRDALQAMR